MSEEYQENSSFHYSDWTEDSKQRKEFPLFEIPDNHANELFSTQLDTRNFDQKQKEQINISTADSSVKVISQLRSPENSVDVFLNFMKSELKTRQGITQQSNSQKIFKFTTNAHPTKNLPAEIFRKIKNFLKKLNKIYLLNDQTKRFSTQQLNEFIINSGLTIHDWEQILDQSKVISQIEKSKKLGTSKHFKNISFNLRKFLLYLNKEVQKIVYRSAKRVIIRLWDGAKFTSYLDGEAHMELHLLDDYLMSSNQHSTEYRYYLSQVNKSLTKNTKYLQ